MNYAIQINSGPNNSHAGYCAYRLSKALISSGNEIIRVFFYQEGILHAFNYATPPAEELQTTKQWSALAVVHNIDLVVCVASAQRRGLLMADEATRQGKGDHDLAAGFRIAGLGQLIDASLVAERFIVFG